MSDENREARGFLPKLESGSKPLIGIVGHGFVGRAVESAFSEDQFDKFLVDPKYNVSIDQLVEKNPNIVYICAPTPSNPTTGRVDAKIVEDSVLKLLRNTDAGIVIKSTIPPDVVDRLLRSIEMDQIVRVIYAPEFLRESSAVDDYLNPEFMVFGGVRGAISELLSLYNSSTQISVPSDKVFLLNPVEASFVKYAINTFLATKVTFFNNLWDAIINDGFGACNPNSILRAVVADSRIGNSHWRVPGQDGKRGYGGACFPKDLNGFIGFTSHMPLLEKVKEINQEYRSGYEAGEREKQQNISFTDNENVIAIQQEESTDVSDEQIEETVQDQAIDETLQLELFKN